MTDTVLMRARSGDAAAMRELLTGLAPAIRRFGRSMCRHDADAEDVLQDTLLLVAQNLDGYDGRASLPSWAFALARSACARRRRGSKNRPSLPESVAASIADDRPNPEEVASEAERISTVARALEALSEEHREVLALRDVEGLSAPEAAAALGIGVDALKSRLHRARQALHRVLAPSARPPVSRACPDILAAWSKQLEGDLRAQDCAALERHLADCPRCTAECDDLKRWIGACARSRDETVTPAIRAQIEQAIESLRARGTLAPR